MFCIFLQSAEERKVKVFQKGERVVCGSKGVCVVEEITTLDIAGVESLIRQIPEIPLITIANDKLLEQEYKNCLKTSSCQDLIRIIKTIYLRKRARKEAGRKETAVDARYFRIAEDHLYGELAVALDMSRENVESYINTSLQSV